MAGLLAGSGCGSCSGGSGGNHAQCNANADCPEGSFCDTLTTGQCQPAACDAHRDCPDQWLCSDEGECYDPTGGHQTDCVPLHPGCQCAGSDLGMSIDCSAYAQPDGVDKSCHTGKSVCDGERYGACEDTYLESCDSIHLGAGEFNPTEENSDNVKLGVEGELQLDPDERHVDFGFLWIANTGESTVSKIDIETGREVARYASALPGPGIPQGAIPYPGAQPWGDCLHCPSRTAIDFNGDAFVANRAFGLQGSVTKFANDTANCVDRDGNGIIDTSWDANDDGVIDVNDPNEFFSQDDECILWTTAVGSVDGKPRGLAIDSGSIPDFGPNGNVWVGVYEDAQAHMLNGDTGEDVAVVDLRNADGVVHPYGAAVDALGYAWFTGIGDGFVAQVDTIGQNLVGLLNKTAGTGCASAYGIAFDVKGRLWLAGFDCNTAVRYDPTDGSWATIDFSSSGRGPHTRGIAPDLAGTVWVAHTEGWVTRFDAETMQEIEAFQLPHHLGPSEQVTDTVGVGIDRNGACWAVSINQGYTNGTATRIQPGAGMDSFPVGLMPYTYSDFTGFGLTTVTRPTGWYNLTVAGCEDQDPNTPPDVVTDWQTLDWNEAQPPGTNVRLRFKVADTLADLDTADWWGPYDDAPVDLDALGVPDSNFMLVQILLSSTDPNETPSFLGLNLGFDCGGGGGPG